MFFSCCATLFNIYYSLRTKLTNILCNSSNPAARRPTAQGSRPKAHFKARGPAARFTVHIPRSSLEFLSAVFYSACSDLCSEIEEGEFWFLCNFHRFNPLQSLYLLLIFAQGANVISLLCVYLQNRIAQWMWKQCKFEQT